MPKQKQQWLGLYEDQARWLRSQIYSIQSANEISAPAMRDPRIRSECFIAVERCKEIAILLDNLLLLYPKKRRPSR